MSPASTVGSKSCGDAHVPRWVPQRSQRVSARAERSSVVRFGPTFARLSTCPSSVTGVGPDDGRHDLPVDRQRSIEHRHSRAPAYTPPRAAGDARLRNGSPGLHSLQPASRSRPPPRGSVELQSAARIATKRHHNRHQRAIPTRSYRVGLVWDRDSRVWVRHTASFW